MKGMTLNEVMMVVIILAVTASLAIPLYMRTAERARRDEAVAVLRMLRAAERVYYLDDAPPQEYAPLTVLPPPGPLVSEGYLQNPNGDPNRAWDYDIVPNADPGFDATATRRSGCNAGETLTIDEAGAEGGTWTLPCP